MYRDRFVVLGLFLLAWFMAISPAQAEGSAVAKDPTPVPAAATGSHPALLRFEDLLAGKHYTLIQNSSPAPGNRPQVLEIFNFKCPHCFKLHPVFAAWAEKNQDRFEIRSLPIVWDNQSDLPVRAYFTALLLGKGKEMQHLLFKATFQDSMEIDNPDVIAFLAEEAGLKADPFKSQLTGFGVVAKVSQAKAQARAFGISGTPSVVVNGRYLVQGTHAEGDWHRFMAIVETLAGH
ncbi:MAG: thiol:disulfide interchange protein DsbA/DsbL [Magnetococcales bacterium]|nr:thiol:disulfide interchange protein DsbA/DsbL [Magnetococcales bacterium]